MPLTSGERWTRRRLLTTAAGLTVSAVLPATSRRSPLSTHRRHPGEVRLSTHRRHQNEVHLPIRRDRWHLRIIPGTGAWRVGDKPISPRRTRYNTTSHGGASTGSEQWWRA